MSQHETVAFTSHAMLVVWGQFAHCLGLSQKLGTVPLHQKAVTHRPQTKILEFLVAILGGLEYLKDISRSAHPLDQDREVAKAWGQPDWADYSGVSRTLSALTMEEARQIVQVLEDVSQPIIDQEVFLALQQPDGIIYDGDLTGRPVSNTSISYPDAGYGHMNDGIHLGYQAAMVSFHSRAYGRLWLSVTPHPGDTVSSTQAEALVLAAERRTGMRPLRRTHLIRQRLQELTRQQEQFAMRVEQAQQSMAQAQERLEETELQVQHWQRQLAQYETEYRARQRAERPYSRLAQARKKLNTYLQRQDRREQALIKVQKHLDRQETRLAKRQTETDGLQARLQQFEQENATNIAPIRATFRLDAGFGTRENLALLIEMGYQVYSKPHGTWLINRLKRQVDDQTVWTKVGSNAEMVAWASVKLKDFPYHLNVALERFHTGNSQRYSALVHFGDTPVVSDLPGWFEHYNGRQTIEAGIKEGKQVFQMHHLKVRSPAALYLQEHFAAFAANFVRLAGHWLITQCPQVPDGWQDTTRIPVKEQVTVAAHTSAWVTWFEQDCLLRFTDHSVFAGRSLQVKKTWAYQPLLPFAKSCCFSPT